MAKPNFTVPIRQPTLVVAWVGRCRRASAHKGCPVFHRRAPELSTTAEADDRWHLAQAAVVIRFHDQVMHNAGIYPEEKRAPNSKVRPTCPERIGLGVANGNWSGTGTTAALGEGCQASKPRGICVRGTSLALISTSITLSFRMGVNQTNLFSSGNG